MSGNSINKTNAIRVKILSSEKKQVKDLLRNFDLEVYYDLLDNHGLDKTWNIILSEFRKISMKELNQTFLKFDDIGELYEIGLAHTNKIEKKEMGKYYTPTDVAEIMAKLLLENENIQTLVDVACGTGNLIIEVLRQAMLNDEIDVINFIKNGNLYLYDIDKLALKICVSKIELLLGETLGEYINTIEGDFLSKKITLPNNCSVITNPPYSLIRTIKKTWSKSDVLEQSKDLYAGFMDKIMKSCTNAVIVSPQSFLVSDKFSKLRGSLGSNFYGEIYSFDNVPGTLFNGRKHGIFNTNSANGVRASISSIKKNGHQGFRLTHLIRFKSDQRKEVINLEFLKSKLGNKVQNLKMPLKVFKELEPLINEILENEKVFIADLIEEDSKKQNEKYKINISTSARYFTVASKRELDRNGQYQIYAKNKDSFKLLYALINSSYVYMWWRFFDGGILFTKRWLLRTPISSSLINCVNEIASNVDEMIRNEGDYLSYKKNAGKYQETIKFPAKYRNRINKKLFKDYYKLFLLLHRNNEVR